MKKGDQENKVHGEWKKVAELFHRENLWQQDITFKRTHKSRDEDGRNDRHYSLALLSQSVGPLFFDTTGNLAVQGIPGRRK